MSISKLTIKNCKSIEFMELNLKENISCFIGTNNVGKSNIMRILNFFYINLTKEFFDESMFSTSNPYNDEIEITVEYDLSELIYKMNVNTAFGFLDPTNEIFEKISSYTKKYSINNRVTLSLKYNRNNNTITWNNKDYDFRAFISVRFPIFLLESRNIDLYNWDLIWKVIGTIAPFRQKVTISDNIKGIFDLEESEQDNYQTVIEDILNEFEKSNIKVRKTNIYEKISQIIQLQIGGVILIMILTN